MHTARSEGATWMCLLNELCRGSWMECGLGCRAGLRFMCMCVTDAHLSVYTLGTPLPGPVPAPPSLPPSPLLCCMATHSRPLCRPSVGFCPFNCNLNKVQKHNQRPGCLSVSSLSSKPPSKYDPVHFFCLAPRPWSTLGGRAWGNTEIWLRFEIPPLAKFQILALSALVTELRYENLAWKPLQYHLQTYSQVNIYFSVGH